LGSGGFPELSPEGCYKSWLFYLTPLLKERAIGSAQEGDQGYEVGCSQKLKG
tara:strand:- start:194976 stop:195131 length:156 start_codon:yes stop_codon:yes gene_type:complete